ncbi:MAG: alpha/beta hydrolase [Burkholderiales bacterium]|nr:alpha/beta hydrolase [Burkholderiales bacterium]
MINQETVILVHGLWLHGTVMALMRRRIARCGYQVVSYSYPSMRLTLTENAGRLAQFCRSMDSSRMHFVGHSLGGLVILRMLERAADLDIGRIVLAGPPFVDSFAARRLARLPGGGKALGRSIPEWLESARPSGLERYDIGVIAGDCGIGLGTLIAPDLPRPSDGVVSVAETRLPTARDHIVLNVSHTAMLVSAAVVRQVCTFLHTGAFSRGMKDEGRGMQEDQRQGVKAPERESEAKSSCDSRSSDLTTHACSMSG